MHSDTAHTQSASSPSDVQTRASLLRRVRDWGDDASWREFFATYSRLIYSLAQKYGLSGSEAEDVVQGTMIRVADAIRDFQYNRETGSFKQWIGNQAKWKISDHLRRIQRDREMLQEKNGTATGGRTKTLERLPDAHNNLEQFFERDWNEAVAATALARVKMRVKPKHFQMFDLYAVKQWPLRRISRTLGVNVAQVYLVKSRISRMLKQQTQQVKAQLSHPPASGFSRQKQDTETA